MTCESCQKEEAQIELPKGNQPGFYRLCRFCGNRLLKKALRPLEFFNLASTHGLSDYYLHDDFYDWDTGEAQQPHIKVKEIDQYPYPKLDQVKGELTPLINYTCAQYTLSASVLNLLKLYDAEAILNCLDMKMRYTDSLNGKLYEIAANVLGRKAETWVRAGWNRTQTYRVSILGEAVAKCLPFEESFSLLTRELEKAADKDLAYESPVLRYFADERTLDWIEMMVNRIQNVHSYWGVLAAASQFSWDRAARWLQLGRPLSLIALDALYYCTTRGRRANQPLEFIEKPPVLLHPEPMTVMVERLKDYLKSDSVPRTRGIIEGIINNLAI